MKIDPSEPAFPTMDAKELDHCAVLTAPGMSVRTYLAAMAMQGLLGQQNGEGPYYDNHNCFEDCAVHAVRQADALIAALNKEPTP